MGKSEADFTDVLKHGGDLNVYQVEYTEEERETLLNLAIQKAKEELAKLRKKLN